MEKEFASQLLEQVRTDYNTISQHFAQTRMNQWYEVDYLIQQYIQPGQLIFDAGCGNGRVADLVTQIKGHYIGMDISPELIAIAQRLRPQHDFRVGSMMDTGFADATFDHSLLIASFHHLPGEDYRIRALEEIRRVTKPEGYIIMTNWNLHQWRRTPTRWKFNLEKMLGHHQMDWNDTLIPWYNADKDLQAERYYHGFTQREIRHLARRAGLEVLDQYYERNGMHVPRRKGFNLVSVLKTQ